MGKSSALHRSIENSAIFTLVGWLVPRIMEDVLGMELPEAGRCQIKTSSILVDFDTWWAIFLNSKNENT
jgi:hypothetical protein